MNIRKSRTTLNGSSLKRRMAAAEYATRRTASAAHPAADEVVPAVKLANEARGEREDEDRGRRHAHAARHEDRQEAHEGYKVCEYGKGA